MAGFSKITIIGNVGRDPEVRFVGEHAVCDFSVAVNIRVKRDGQWVDQVEWFNVCVWGKQAENAGQYLQKGKQVHVDGQLRTEKWTDKKTGDEKSALKLHADSVTFLGSKGDGEQRPSGQQRPAPAKPHASTGAAPPASDGFIDDELNF